MADPSTEPSVYSLTSPYTTSWGNVPFSSRILFTNPFSYCQRVFLWWSVVIPKHILLLFSSNSKLTLERFFKRKHAVWYNHQQTCLVLPSWVWLAHFALPLRPFCPPRHCGLLRKGFVTLVCRKSLHCASAFGNLCVQMSGLPFPYTR